MNPFVFQNPVKLIFGQGKISSLAREIPDDARILVTFGGGSVKRNGIYDQVMAALSGRTCFEFWGIEPNPCVETIRECVLSGKEQRANFVLAVGGGSVIDASKLIAAALKTDKDPWDMVREGCADDTLPLGTVLTIPATGSEMNGGAVISSAETHEKLVFYSRHPRFSILDPSVTFSLPKEQIAYGLADTFVHILEQYLTTPAQSRVMDRFAEGLIHNLVELAPLIQENPYNYDLMADFMLTATMGLNGFIGMGVTQDWATHMIGHELTALSGLSHAATLALVLPGLLTVMQEQKGDKILQLGERIWGILSGTRNDRIAATITRCEDFFRALGLKTRLHEAGIDEKTEAEIVRRFAARNVAFGEARNVDAELTRRILIACR